MDFKSYKQKLQKFIGIKSVSTDSKYQPEINKTVNWLKTLLKKSGFSVKTLKGPKTNPIIFGSYNKSSSTETILIYGHYDVQPASKDEGWTYDPFKMTEKNGRLLGRGVVDNKGQVLIHIHTITNLIKSGKLKYNIKFIIEGNEETGNEDFSKIIKDNKELLKCDHVVVSDGEITNDQPTIDAAFRGGSNLTVTFKTAKTSLHSGIYGGAIPNAAHELSKLIAKFYDDNNKVTIPGFYKDVDKVTKEELANNKSISFSLKELKKMTGVKQLLTEPRYDFYTQVGLRPMITVTGLKSGYIGEGYNNIVVNTAEARINFRFVISQKPKSVLSAFEKFVSKNTPDYVEYKIDKSACWSPIKLNVSSDKFKEVKDLLEETYKDSVIFKYVGGSIPAIVDFKEILGKDTISVGLANEDCNMHGVDENFRIDLIKKGLRFSKVFFGE
ncbi:MAG: M20/M25/M40 family metallo-hydrolase [Patescibacteria group bacterium]|nr:M20/M25/M40 family metallo-hydrolase [Patescibacteria group bacterium]